MAKVITQICTDDRNYLEPCVFGENGFCKMCGDAQIWELDANGLTFTVEQTRETDGALETRIYRKEGRDDYTYLGCVELAEGASVATLPSENIRGDIGIPDDAIDFAVCDLARTREYLCGHFAKWAQQTEGHQALEKRAEVNRRLWALVEADEQVREAEPHIDKAWIAEQPIMYLHALWQAYFFDMNEETLTVGKLIDELG